MSKLLLVYVVLTALQIGNCLAGGGVSFNPDTDPSWINWSDVPKKLGPAPDVRGQRFGVVIKNYTNEYWRFMAAGYRKRAAADGVKLDIQAAQGEGDPIRQLAIMENMVGGLYKGLLVSPQSSSNLQSAIDDAISANLPIVDVDGAVVDSITHFVGAVNRDMGVRVANWFIQRYPAGGKLAIVKGQAGIFSTVQRSGGFIETLATAKNFHVAAIVAGNWDRQTSYARTIEILRKDPDIIGIYCNNDVMALGVVDAVKALNMLGTVRVFGTDGTHDAYASIKAGELTGTVDIFPSHTGEIGLDIAERLSVGQAIPRVVVTPQALVTLDDITRYNGNEEMTRANLFKAASR